ncbi:MAG: aspartate aminotransferase family protein [Syntrophaceae bacterium]|nr:aspartate aminotransferase family protein [Syntrophaceae bacterium]
MKEMQYPKSYETLEAGKEFIPGGVMGTRRPENFIPDVYPLYVKQGKGAHFFDIDGHEYIDWLAGFGPVLLGHSYEVVDNAAIDRIRKGFCFNLSQDVQNILAEKITQIIPCAEKAIFVLSGSDATTAAIRLARAYTGRDKILKFGYNGWHDWCVPVATGVPDKAREDIIPFKYNDINSVIEAMDKFKGKVAGVILTPLAHEFNRPLEFPQNNFLEKLREITKMEGALLIFDEIRTGFRIALGGAQEYFGVKPDLAAFGKAMANGYPIGLVAGSADVMMASQKAYISSTFFYNSFPMCAAVATLNEIESKGVIAHIWKLGKILQQGMQDLVAKYNLPAVISGPPPMPFLTFSYNPDKKYVERRKIFYTETTRNGIFLHPYHHWYVLFTHTENDVHITLDVIDKAFKKIVEKVK